MPDDLPAVLAAALERALPAATWQWLCSGLPQPGRPQERGAFFGTLAGVARRTRGASLALSAGELRRLVDRGVLSPAAWSAGELSRVALLVLACAALPAHDHVGLLREAFDKGDNDERVAALRALPLLPAPERFLELATDACRTNVVDVFRAIACHNTYPLRFFPELSWNQLVMKAFFLGVPIADIEGIAARNNPELSRMASDLRAERRAAGRPLPPELSLVHPSPEPPA